MNRPIRSEPLPFPAISEKGAAEGTLCTRAPEVPFERVLSSELKQDSGNEEPSESAEKDQTKAAEAYAVAPIVLKILPEISLNASEAPNETVAPDPLAGTGEAAPAETSPEVANANPAPETSSKSQNEVARTELISRLKALEAVEQKVPTPTLRPTAPLEQIASKRPDPAKIAHGMVAAQRPAMLMTTPTREESASREKLGIEHFEAPAFEQPVRFNPFPREAAPKRDFEQNHFGSGEGFQFDSPRFEAISGDIEVQPVQQVEPTSMVDAIRTHVELLKTSGESRLDVVLRPDAQTELHIHVEKVNGQIQVQARCDRGDFALLDSQWNSIQSTLSAQGIRVEPLQQGNNANFQQNSHNSQQFNNPQNSQNAFGRDSGERQQNGRTFIEQQLSQSKVARPQSSRPTNGRGWQTWA